MIMWILIFIAMFAVMLLAMVYLTSRVCRLSPIGRAAHGNRHVRRLLAALPVLLLFGGCYLAMDLINAAIVLVHALFVWLLIDGINLGIQRLRGKQSNYDVVALLGTVFLVLYFAWAWREAHHVAATRYEVETEKVTAPLRLVQITDSHLGVTLDGEGFARELEKVQREQPDAVVITGDFVDDDSSLEDMMRACEALGDLETACGVYFVFGNHDKGYYNSRRGYGEQELVEQLKANGVRVLEDEAVELRDDCWLIGRRDRSDELRGSGRLAMEELVGGLDRNKYMIVLDHQPNDFAAQEESGVDLVLSGHTHGGQFFPINYLGEWTGVNDMTYGLRRRGGTTFEVSSGISDWAIKFKTGCRAEYVVLDIGN